MVQNIASYTVFDFPAHQKSGFIQDTPKWKHESDQH